MLSPGIPAPHHLYDIFSSISTQTQIPEPLSWCMSSPVPVPDLPPVYTVPAAAPRVGLGFPPLLG